MVLASSGVQLGKMHIMKSISFTEGKEKKELSTSEKLESDVMEHGTLHAMVGLEELGQG